MGTESQDHKRRFVGGTERAREQAVDSVDEWILHAAECTITDEALTLLIDVYAQQLDEAEQRGRIAGLREALRLIQAEPTDVPKEEQMTLLKKDAPQLTTADCIKRIETALASGR
jgi:hypothetical protein